MKNVETTLDGNKLIITVDISQDFGPSKSGKTTIIASTEGNVPVEGHSEIRFCLKVYKYLD